MITISKIPDGKNWADAIAQYRSKGMRTNFYAAAEEFLPQLQWLSELKFDGGCYLFHEKEKQIDLYFFLEQGRKAEQIPVFDKPVLLEQVGVTKAPPDLAEWEEIGFVRYLQRKRLFLSARNVEKTERVPSFAKEEEAETILALMQQSFEPYTSALPGRISAKTVCLRQGRGRSFLVFCASAEKRRYPSSGRLRLRRTAEERALEAVWCRIGLS